MTRGKRKQLLILACQVDRVAWAQACRPRRPSPAPLAGYLLKGFETVTALLPGRPGRWLRGVNILVRFGRQFGWLTS